MGESQRRLSLVGDSKAPVEAESAENHGKTPEICPFTGAIAEKEGVPAPEGFEHAVCAAWVPQTAPHGHHCRCRHPHGHQGPHECGVVVCQQAWYGALFMEDFRVLRLSGKTVEQSRDYMRQMGVDPDNQGRKTIVATAAPLSRIIKPGDYRQ